MTNLRTIVIVSDIHYAGAAEQQRGWREEAFIGNPVLRSAVRAYRHFIWKSDPFGHNHLLERFLKQARNVDFLVVNGDYSCDSACVGVSDDAAYESAEECLRKLRQRFHPNLRLTIGDHELGKMSLFGGRGGLRLASWHRSVDGLGLQPYWELPLGRHLLIGVTSSLVALPVFEPETLLHERADWHRLRREHLDRIRSAFGALRREQRVLLFCHDPTALPFLWRDDLIRSRLDQVSVTVIGHLHSELIFWKSRLLAGMPPLRFLGNSIRRMSSALHEARVWRSFHVRLCPALAGIQLLKDGGYLDLRLDLEAGDPPEFCFHPMPWPQGNQRDKGSAVQPPED